MPLVAKVDEDGLVMVHSPLADVLGVDVLATNLGDRVDEPLNHLAHRVRLVLDAVVLRVLPHHDDAMLLVVVEDLRQVRVHDAMLSQTLESCHLRRRVPSAGRVLLAGQRELDDEVTVQNLTTLAECPGANPAKG